MERSERWLILLLRLGGIVTGSAVFTIFLPESTMAATHEGLGLGEFPAVPLTSYLARSVSAMYAFHGVILLALSTDVRRYRRLVEILAWATAAMGVALLGIDLWAPMPLWWTLCEGPTVILIGLVLVALVRGVPEAE
jgi:hypothetical protein